MKDRILSLIRANRHLYAFAKYLHFRLKTLHEPKLKYSDLSESEKAIYHKIKQALK
jgi:hypothetical protein